MTQEQLRIEEITPNETEFGKIPVEGRYVKWYEHRQRITNKELNSFVDQRVRMDDAKVFTAGSLVQVRKFPRYHARRFGMWNLFNISEDYKNYLLTLTNHQCRVLDIEAAKQEI